MTAHDIRVGAGFAWERGVLYIAIDGAQLKSALAYQGFLPSGDRVRGVIRCDDIRHIATTEATLKGIAESLVFRRVVLAVEYPMWNTRSAPTVRAAANAWIRAIKSTFPRKVEVRRVDPNEWQNTFQFRRRSPDVSTKEYALWLATKVYGWAVETGDEADAALILEDARTFAPDKYPRRNGKRNASALTP